MPIVAHSSLPTFDRLRDNGQEVLTLDRALRQDIRELHIGLLNMMPDAALEVTERQYLRLVGNSNQIAQFYIHPFSVPTQPRSPKSQAYIDQFYEKFEDIQKEGLDALIITGANPAYPSLDQEPFWRPLIDVMTWAQENVTSVLCSCLATHALVKYFHRIERVPLPKKQWGVYSHRVIRPTHPLLRDINTRFDAPHSRHNAVTREQLDEAGLVILVESEEAGVHAIASPDQFRFIYFQGHPEYDVNSLLKEYKREVTRYLDGDRPDIPPHPENYFHQEASQIVDQYLKDALAAQAKGLAVPPFPEAQLLLHLDNTWGDTAKAIFNNWLGLVYRVTHHDRTKLFADNIDPMNPLGLHEPARAITR